LKGITVLKDPGRQQNGTRSLQSRVIVSRRINAKTDVPVSRCLTGIRAERGHSGYTLEVGIHVPYQLVKKLEMLKSTALVGTWVP